MVAGCVGTVADARALTPAQIKKKVATLTKQLSAQPKHKAHFPKLRSLVTKLVELNPKKASVYLGIALPKISMVGAKRNASSLTNAVNGLLKRAKLSAALKASLTRRNVALLKKYVPPPPPHQGPYQSRNDERPAIRWEMAPPRPLAV